MTDVMDARDRAERENKRLTERQDQMNRIALENEKVLNRALDDATATQTALASALRDNAALTEQVTALQARCTALLELTRERDVEAHVRQLFQGYMQEIPEVPCVPDAKTMRLRVELVREEFEELMDACGYEHVGSTGIGVLDWKQTGKPDLVKIVDACIDIIVVTIGMLVACGVRFWPMWWAVQRSNVAKFGGPKDANGKQRKPANWQPPDVAGELRKQGFRD